MFEKFQVKLRISNESVDFLYWEFYWKYKQFSS